MRPPEVDSVSCKRRCGGAPTSEHSLEQRPGNPGEDPQHGAYLTLTPVTLRGALNEHARLLGCHTSSEVSGIRIALREAAVAGTDYPSDFY